MLIGASCLFPYFAKFKNTSEKRFSGLPECNYFRSIRRLFRGSWNCPTKLSVQQEFLPPGASVAPPSFTSFLRLVFFFFHVHTHSRAYTHTRARVNARALCSRAQEAAGSADFASHYSRGFILNYFHKWICSALHWEYGIWFHTRHSPHS